MATAYDAVPYANLPFSQTRPAVLATVAGLHGLHAADPRSARVLELGCGAGANLAGIAAADAAVQAVGIDLAPTAVERARDLARAAGLDNVVFEVGDVLELTDGRLGEFDYVIVHGLYAWADERLREATLAACRAHLAPEGLAYVSYTAQPGGHLRRMLREMAEWHARAAASPLDRADRARSLFALLDALGASDAQSFYTGVLADDLHSLATGPAEMLVHDLLGPDYEPVWVADFAADAARHDLEHVADALPEGSRRPPWSAAVEAFVDEAAGDDPVAREQYFDILVLRRFRQSLLCRFGRRPTPRVQPGALQAMLVAAEGTGAGEPPRLLARALAVLSRAAAPVAFAALREELEVDAAELGGALLEGFDTGWVAFHAVPPPAVRVAGARPEASGLARSQAREGALVTTLLNQVVRIRDEPTARLLALLDGTRDRAAIMRDFAAAGSGSLAPEALDAALTKLAGLALLRA